MGTRVLGTFPPVGDWRSRSSTGLLEVDLQYVTVTKITRTGVDWRYCTASTPQPWATGHAEQDRKDDISRNHRLTDRALTSYPK